MKNEKCLINNKKRFNSVFKQILTNKDAIVKVIKDSKMKKIHLIPNLDKELIGENIEHVRFSILLVHENEKIIEFIIRDTKIYLPIDDDGKFKLKNMSELQSAYMKYIKNELCRYLARNKAEVNIEIID